MENGDPRVIPGIVVLIVLIIPIVLAYLWVIIKQWLDNVGDYSPGGNSTNKYAYINKYNEDKETKIEKYLKKNERIDRERPPNASFFSRVDGKETFIEGPPEEQWLNRYEAIKWKYKKRKRELKKKITKV